ncbi:MAG: AAA family ATPase [Clostridia bacterium]|nr:AAA family ATPase [Clostridia bacterium]
MSDFLSFDIKVPGEIRIKLTNAAINAAAKLQCGNRWFQNCSASSRILVSFGSEGNVYFMHLGGNIFTCKVAAEDNDPRNFYFVATNIQPENYNKKNMALHSGLCFYFESGIMISYFNQSKGFHYRNGNSVLSSFANRNCTAGLNAIVTAFKNKEHITASQEEDKGPSPQLMEYLNLAREYSEAEFELEETRALSNDPLYYDGVSGCDYERIANSTYRFFVNRLDDTLYPIGGKVEITDANDEKLRATLVDAGTEEDGRYFVDLLFNSQLSINMIPSVGSITLSFSSVNRDVQQKAIEKILDGTSDARYLNDVLGLAQPIGFEDLDLSGVKAVLKSYKNKPNDSQEDAICKGIKTKDVYLVMGPPGTGKTTVILEWIKYFVHEKKMRVLVSSQNNKAVDNVLERIIKEEGINALRIGSENKVAEQIKPCLFDLKLESLRSKIKTTTDNHAETIAPYTEYWTGINGSLLSVEPLYSKKGELEKALEAACNELLASAYQLEDLLARYRTREQITEANVFKINLLIDKEQTYRNKNAFLRFILKPISLFRTWRIGRLITRHDDNLMFLSQLLTSYNNKRDEHIHLFDHSVTEVYIPERESAAEIAEKMADFSIDYDGQLDPYAIYDLTQFKEQDITAYSYYTSITSALQTALSRAAALITELQRWQSVAVDTSNYTLKNILFEEVNLVGATCIGINSQHRFADLNFDVSIIDEAGQIQIHNALVPMSVSNKLIMLGDHKQIPPMADQELLDILNEHQIPTDLLEKSLFEDMYERLPEENKSMLDTQYRMPAEIANIISDWFYGGEYKSFTGKFDLPSAVPALSDRPFLIVDTSDSGKERWERSIPQGEQIVHDNPLEASVAAQIVAALHQDGYNLNNVGIIAALKAQVDLIRKELRKNDIPAELTNELAATLDSYQGQERNIIIYSFGRSSGADPSRNGVGFLTELRRLNVAMSRCKETLIMIGDMTFLSSRESETDYKGNLITDERKTEKNFGHFIQHMLTGVTNGSGEIINVQTFKERMAQWNHGNEGGMTE